MQNIISGHNKQVLNPTITNDKQCNCRKNTTCPVEKQCQKKGIIYQATVTTKNTSAQETYIGLTANSIKDRITKHKTSFKYKKYKNKTTLSQHIWGLKEQKLKYSIKWEIMETASSYSPISNICQLCTREKYYIIFKSNLCTLNTRNEIGTHCRHKKKLLLYKT